jgi:hypothetical protein
MNCYEDGKLTSLYKVSRDAVSLTNHYLCLFPFTVMTVTGAAGQEGVV